MIRKVFECKITKNKIIFWVEKDVCYIDLNNVNYKEPKGFFLLLRTSIEQMKDQKIKKLRQCLLYYDWEKNLKNKSSFKEIKKMNDLVIIECDISDALENIAVGHGIKKILKF